jgi:hypothetical protein
VFGQEHPQLVEELISSPKQRPVYDKVGFVYDNVKKVFKKVDFSGFARFLPDAAKRTAVVTQRMITRGRSDPGESNPPRSQAAGHAGGSGVRGR